MKICFICNEYPPSSHGGIGTVTQTLAREFVRQGHRVRVVGLRELGDTAPDREIDRGVEVLRYSVPNARHIGWIRRRYFLYNEIRRLVLRGEVDVVEAPDFEGWTAGWGRLGVPIVVRLHGSASYFSREVGSRPSRLIYEIERQAINNASYQCSCSCYTADMTRQLFDLKRFEPKILYNPLPSSEKFTGRLPIGQRVVFTGTLVAKKGVVHLVRAWPMVIQAFPDAQLHVYGRDGRSPAGGSMREYLTAQLPAGARPSVVFHGAVPHDMVLQALRTARLAVFPSLSEAFGVAPMESMSQGCPTIYTRRASGPELITDGEDGLLIDPTNKNEIASAIARVLANADLARRLGAAGRKRAQDFSVELIARKNVDFYHHCMSSHRALRATLWQGLAPTTARWLAQTAGAGDIFLGYIASELLNIL
jgi:glycosyltransferase involved in cell wall biosynthesis